MLYVIIFYDWLRLCLVQPLEDYLMPQFTVNIGEIAKYIQIK